MELLQDIHGPRSFYFKLIFSELFMASIFNEFIEDIREPMNMAF